MKPNRLTNTPHLDRKINDWLDGVVGLKILQAMSGLVQPQRPTTHRLALLAGRVVGLNSKKR